MKKVAILLSTFVLTSMFATTITLYQDETTGALYTKPGPNRVELGEFISAKEFNEENKKIKTKMSKILKATQVSSSVKKIKFSGVHYLGFTHINYENSDLSNINRFESRRNYFQVKAYFNNKDYIRLTLDTFHDNKDDGAQGSWLVRLKYAYIYLDNILPYTGVEFGQVHRPWIDFEEHHGWLYRSIAKTFVEEKNGAHLTNSADLGINFKTKSDYFSSEVGLFNGEGYHFTDTKNNKELSFEYRVTAHLLGSGKKHIDPTKDRYADISVTGQINPDYKNSNDDFKWYAIHGVYNQPKFLIAAMYASSKPSDDIYDGDGWSVNGEFRPVKNWSIFGRYDVWTSKSDIKDTKRKEWIAGAAYRYNKNVRFIGNLFQIDPDTDTADDKETRVMATAEVKW
jgi:hypothetical protein